MVPDGWSISKLAERPIRVIDGDRGKNYPSAGDFADTGHCLFLSAKNVTKNGFLFEEKQFVSEEKHRALRKGTLTRGDIVLTTRGTVGNIAYFDDDVPFDVMRINSGMVLVRNEDEQVSVDFLSLLFRSFVVQNQVKRMTFGSAQPQLTVGIINRFKLPLPPLPEQRKIADILSTWDAAIRTTEALLATARAQKRALMQQLLTNKRRFPEFEGQPWQEVRLGDVLGDKKTKGKIVETNTDGQGQPYIGATSFEGNFAVFTNDARAVLCEPADLLVLWDGENAGAAAVGLRGAVSSTVVRFRFDEGKVSANFVAAHMEIRNYQIRAVREGSGIPHMPKDFEQWFKFSLPTVAEQVQIMSAISGAQTEVRNLANEITKLRTEKKALMQQLLTGKRRVTA